MKRENHILTDMTRRRFIRQLLGLPPALLILASLEETILPQQAAHASLGTSAVQRIKNRTPGQLPNNLYLGDVDGDGTDEFLQVAGNRLLVFRTNVEVTGVLHHYFAAPISRLIIGDFTNQGREHGRDQVCVVLADGSLQALAISDDLQELWWWFTQGSIVNEGESVIVGDFDGDGADDILIHNPKSGELRMYSRMQTGYFDPMPGFVLGNLSTANLVGTQILAGEFGQVVGRDDLLVIDRQTGQVSRYDSVTDNTGAKTFWWAFTTNGGVVSANDQVVIANTEGGATDSIVIRNLSTGTYRMCKAEYGNGNLVGVSGVALGQLPVKADHAVIASARLKEAELRSESGGTARHDFLFFDIDTGQVTRTDGRYDGSQFTYWWAYDRPTPTYNQGWPTKQNEKWAVLLCHPADNPTRKHSLDFFKQLFTAAGSGGMTDYFMDISYGTLDIGSTEVLPPGTNDEPYRLSYTMTNFPKGKDTRALVFDEAVRVSGIDTSKYTHKVVVTDVSGFEVYGGLQGVGAVISLTVYNQDDGFSTHGIAHEMLHGYNLAHAHARDDHDLPGEDKNQYGDPWDIMGRSYTFTGFNQMPSGPELNAPHKAQMSFFPDSRVLTLTPNPSNQQTYKDIPLAAINRPEANGYLAVKIPIQDGVADHAFFVEFRQKSFWDRAIPQDTVLIHEYKIDKDGNHASFLQTGQGSSQFLPGMTFQHPSFTVTVQQIHGPDHQAGTLASTATVSITC